MREGLLTLKATYKNGRRYEIQSFPHQLFPLLAFGLDGSTELSLIAMQQRTGASTHAYIVTSQRPICDGCSRTT
eukprot:34768-Eustigmatos_ZCMA.PRE.1